MTTARAQLHNEIVEVISGKNRADLEQRLDELLGHYRVQYKKPPADGGKPVTARATLVAKVVLIAKRPAKDPVAQISGLLDDFRMQFKSEGKDQDGEPEAPATGRKPKKAKAGAVALAAETKPARATKVKSPAAAAAAAANAAAGAMVGGKARSTRSECPKCHSMGVVLARSYAADEYFSCIYCGWQGYKSPEATEADDSLAARLLGLYSGGSETESDEEAGGDGAKVEDKKEASS